MTPDTFIEALVAQPEKSAGQILAVNKCNFKTVKRWRDADPEGFGARYEQQLELRGFGNRKGVGGRPKLEATPGRQDDIPVFLDELQAAVERSARSPVTEAERRTREITGNESFSCQTVYSRINPDSGQFDPEFAAVFADRIVSLKLAKASDRMLGRTIEEVRHNEDLKTFEMFMSKVYGRRRLEVSGTVAHEHTMPQLDPLLAEFSASFDARVAKRVRAIEGPTEGVQVSIDTGDTVPREIEIVATKAK